MVFFLKKKKSSHGYSVSSQKKKTVNKKVFTQITEFPYLENHIVIQMNEMNIGYYGTNLYVRLKVQESPVLISDVLNWKIVKYMQGKFLFYINHIYFYSF